MKNIKEDTLEFSAVINVIQNFLEPVLDTIMNEEDWQQEWKSNMSRWSNMKGAMEHDKSN